MAICIARCPAKINITLRVGPRRDDGFHEIESLVAQVDLCDILAVEPQEPGCWSIACDDPAVPADDSNLVLRAARLLAERFPAEAPRCGARVRLEKHIPPGSGLGGGSSNAAAALRLFDELWGLGLSSGQLAEVGAALGSDVPLFLNGRQCIAAGRGERIEPVAQPVDGWVVLILSGITCPTERVYAEFDRLEPPSPAPGARQVLGSARGAAALMLHAYNQLEPAALRLHPSLRGLARAAELLACGPVRMSGSGSALYRLFDDERGARAFAARVADELPCQVKVARLLAG